MTPLPLSITAGRRAEFITLAGVLVLAFGIGYWNQTHGRYAAVLAALPLLVALFCKPHVPLVLGVGALPLQLDIVGGSVHLTTADVLLTFALVAAVPPLLLNADWSQRVRQAAPLLIAAAPFTVWLAVVALDHGTLGNALKTGQYYQLFLLPLVLGAVVIGPRAARAGLTAFVAAAALIAALWATTGGNFSFAGNKNPSGQFIADAIILVLALAPSWRWRLVALTPLAIGLGFTQSRGAILAAGVGVLVVLALRGLGTWRRTLAAVLPLAVVVIIGYELLPADVQARTTDFSAGNSSTSLADLSSSEYSVRLRQIYRDNGWKLVNAHPVYGVGPGNYTTGAPGSPEQNTDPHDLIIRTAGDAGYPGLVTFGILLIGSAFLALRRRRVSPYAVVAVALQAAIVTHGFVDVYWVRGTPVIGWLLIGMALNPRMDGTRDRPGRHRGRLSQRRSAEALPVLTAG